MAKEQFLPDVAEQGGAWFARWTATLAGADAGRFDRLAKAMPAADRAVGDTAPDRPAAAVLRDFLGFVVDELVRWATPEPADRADFDSVHDRWLHAFRSATGEMGGREAESSQFAAQVREWRRPIAAASAAPFRLCFRQDEPADGAAVWHVRYLLQGRDDPSLQLPAAAVWAGTAPAALTRGDLKPTLLAGLGQAGNLSREIDASLRSAAPAGFATTADGAHRFLTETAWLLEQAGFGVLLPAWWTGLATKQRLTVAGHAKSPPMPTGKPSEAGVRVASAAFVGLVFTPHPAARHSHRELVSFGAGRLSIRPTRSQLIESL